MAPLQPPTGTSTEPRRTRCTSPHATSAAPYRFVTSSTAHASASTATEGFPSPRGVVTIFAWLHFSANAESRTRPTYRRHQVSKSNPPLLSGATVLSHAFNTLVA